MHNSLQPGGPVPFVPIEKGKISWYACGPTVYDHSHLGHSRNYVSTDIIRRILRDYFKFEIKYVMNITDIDDKIIIKARRQKLLEVEKSKPYSEAEISQLAMRAFQFYAESNLPALLDSSEPLTPSNYVERRDAAYGRVLAGSTLSKEGKPGDAEAKMKMHLANLTSASTAIQENEVFGGADEILLPYLDSLYKETFDAKDQSIFTNVTKFWEDDFMDDMDTLNVVRPDVLTRVTEYVPQIVKFVEQIVQKGFAYEADGSIYFDIAAFEKAGNTYAHLKPENKNDKALQEEGEGALSKGVAGKRGGGDFALWKKSKPGEPYWPSPWGAGRPGWHIECSVMASDILGSQIDIHSGGVDLAFPHHDNELAQSEAYYCEHGNPHTWVNYFLHMGHLSIAGSKMSKSLKNFQTIKEALKSGYTPRGLRIVFLLGRWDQGCEISPDLRTQADVWESTISKFFTNVKSLLSEASNQPSDLKNLSLDKSRGLSDSLEKAKAKMHSALSDSIDTPRAMLTIQDLIKETNIYMNAHKANVDLAQVEKVARWITQLVGIFGLDKNASPPYDGLGWAPEASNSSVDPEEAVKPYKQVYGDVTSAIKSLGVHSDILDGLLALDVDQEFIALVSSGSSDSETIAMPYLQSISRMRDELRKLAPTTPDHKKAILSLSDKIRDDYLTNIGVYLDDRTDQPSLIKFVPKAELIAAREEKLAKDREKAAAKQAAREAKEKADREKAEKAKVDPKTIFRDAEGVKKYSEWDTDGLPTKMLNGDEVPKAQSKKLRKEWERQKKLFDAAAGGA